MAIKSWGSLSVTALSLVLGVAAAPRASASGFQLRDQSGSGQGNAYAGISAGGSDISAMFFNPATLTRYEGNQLQFGLTEILPSSKLSNASASQPAPAPLGGPVSGPSATGNIASSATLPTLYALWSVDNDLKLAISVNVPFGLTTQYSSGWAGRYQALRSHLETLDITPTVAYRLDSKWSMGASFVARRAKADLSQALDLGYSGGGFLTQAGFSTPTLGTGKEDGSVDVQGSSWAYGYKLGLLYEPSPALHIGLGYQSEIKEDIKGTATFDTSAFASQAGTLVGANGVGIIPALGVLQNATANGSASALLRLPSTISLGAAWDVSSTFSLAAEISDTKWSCFKELRIKFSNPNTQPDQVTDENWKDAIFMAVGATCKPGNAWTYRAGVALDKSPVTDANRTARIPDADRTWLSAGLSYQFTPKFGVDAGYSHLICKDSSVNLQNATGEGNLSGTYKNSIDVLALQARYIF